MCFYQALHLYIHVAFIFQRLLTEDDLVSSKFMPSYEALMPPSLNVLRTPVRSPMFANPTTPPRENCTKTGIVDEWYNS